MLARIAFLFALALLGPARLAYGAEANFTPDTAATDQQSAKKKAPVDENAPEPAQSCTGECLDEGIDPYMCAETCVLVS